MNDFTVLFTLLQCATHRGFGYKITVDPPLSDEGRNSSPPLLPTTAAMQVVILSVSVIVALLK